MSPSRHSRFRGNLESEWEYLVFRLGSGQFVAWIERSENPGDFIFHRRGFVDFRCAQSRLRTVVLECRSRVNGELGSLERRISLKACRLFFWIPAFAGMTEERAEMTVEKGQEQMTTAEK